MSFLFWESASMQVVKQAVGALSSLQFVENLFALTLGTWSAIQILERQNVPG